MRLRINGHDVEGTAEEVANLLRLLSSEEDSREATAAVLSAPAAPPERKGVSPFISEEVAFNIVTRLPLAPPHETLLKKLAAAGEDWTSAPALQAALGCSTREFAGLLGSFGRRISHTPGAGSRPFFDQYWDGENGHNLYRLPSSVRSALRKAKVI